MSNVAIKADIPRTSAYPFVQQLVDAGLIKKHLRSGKGKYQAESPDVLLVLLEKRKDEVNRSFQRLKAGMGELKALEKTQKDRPKIQFLEGAEGIKQAYNRTFEAKEVLVQCLTDDYKDVVSGKFFDDYFKKFFNKTNIKSKEILTLDDQKYIDKYGSKKNLQRMVPTKGNVETDIMIYEGTVIFVSFNKERPYAIIIEDENLANSMRNMYELAWERAGEMKS